MRLAILYITSCDIDVHVIASDLLCHTTPTQASDFLCLQDLDDLRVELLTSRESQGSLRTQYSELESRNADLNYELEEVKHRMEAEVELRRSLELERDTARDELQSMHGLVENETQSLRFRLSSQTMELQQANQVRPHIVHE